MKTILSIIAALMIAATSFAQTPAELARMQQDANKIYMKILNMKPTKDAKREAKELKKQGWTVPAGMKSIEMQITESQIYGEELMADENGNPTKRYLLQSGQSTAGTANAAANAARANARVELAAALQTRVAAAMQSKIDNAQSSSINAVTVDKFHERAKAIVDAALTSTLTPVTIYRVLPNHNFEYQVRMVFDRKELAARMKRNMQKQLEMEGDEELNGLVDEVLSE